MTRWPRMERIEAYLRRAEEAETTAQHTLNPDLRRQFLEVADAWRDLAREADRLQRHGFESSGD
jgi:hypothetical protein